MHNKENFFQQKKKKDAKNYKFSPVMESVVVHHM